MSALAQNLWQIKYRTWEHNELQNTYSIPNPKSWPFSIDTEVPNYQTWEKLLFSCHKFPKMCFHCNFHCIKVSCEFSRTYKPHFVQPYPLSLILDLQPQLLNLHTINSQLLGTTGFQHGCNINCVRGMHKTANTQHISCDKPATHPKYKIVTFSNSYITEVEIAVPFLTP